MEWRKFGLRALILIGRIDRYGLIHPSVQTPILDRLGDMFRRDLLVSFNVGDGPRNFKNSIICPR